jgi:hypothetical protein
VSEELISFKNSRVSKILFLLCLAVAAFWCIGRFINVYHFAFVGAVFEILWLPMIAMVFILPVISAALWVKQKFNPRSLYLYSFLMVATLLILMLFAR